MRWQTGLEVFVFVCLSGPLCLSCFPVWNAHISKSPLCLPPRPSVGWDVTLFLCLPYSSSGSVCAMNSSRLQAVQELSQANATLVFSSVTDMSLSSWQYLIPRHAHQWGGWCAVTVASSYSCPGVSGAHFSETTEVCVNFVKWWIVWTLKLCLWIKGSWLFAGDPERLSLQK